MASALSAQLITQALRTAQLGTTLHVLEKTSSTNSVAIDMVKAGASHGTVVLAECQTAGRGRLGRPWFSPSGTNLYCSLILRDLPPSDRIPWIPLMTGLGLAACLQHILHHPPFLKWPNDILIGLRKIGGILCESTYPINQSRSVIVGVGLNINSNLKDFPDELQDSVTSLLIETKTEHDRNHIAALLLSHLENQYAFLHNAPIDDIRETYRSSCSTIGQHIHVKLASDQQVDGMAVDIEPDGALTLSKTHAVHAGHSQESEIMILRSGEVTHVRQRDMNTVAISEVSHASHH